MRKEIITAIDRDGIEVRIHSLVFNIYKEKINLIDTIKGAVASYINSGYGFREYENNCYNFNWGDLLLIDNGTESKEEVDSYCSGWLNAYASFSSYHADFTAVLFANMKSIKRNPVVRYVVKNIKWDTDGDQESFDSLPQEVILPAKFSKENYKDENGIFGKAEKIEMLDDISDWLSNGYGFCNNGFELTQKEV